jgi:hypothetical protein
LILRNLIFVSLCMPAFRAIFAGIVVKKHG